MAELPVAQAIPRLKANEERFDLFINGDAATTYRSTDDVDVPSVRKFLVDQAGKIDSAKDYVDVRVDQIPVGRGLFVAAPFAKIERDPAGNIGRGVMLDGFSVDYTAQMQVTRSAHPRYRRIYKDKFGNVYKAELWDEEDDKTRGAPATVTEGGRTVAYLNTGAAMLKLSRDAAGNDIADGASDGAAFWRNVNGATVTPRAAWVDRINPVGADVTTVWGIPGIGQSLSVGTGSPGLVTPEPLNVDRAMTWAVGPRPLQVAAAADNQNVELDYRRLRHISPSFELINDENYAGETPTTRMLATLAARRPRSEAFMGWQSGLGSLRIAEHAPGTVPFKNLMQCVAEATLAFAMRGKTFKVLAVFFKVGESEYGATVSGLKATIIQRQLDLAAAIQAITGQAEDIPLVTSQPTGRSNATDTYAAAPLALLELAVEQPSKFLLGSPDYYLPHADNLHLTALSYALLGEQMARLLDYRLTGANFSSYGPTYMISAVKAADKITATFNRPIVVDTMRVTDPGSRGFSLKSSGTSIASVAAPSGSSIEITTTAPVSGGAVLCLARDPTNILGSGPDLGARSNIRDAGAEVSKIDGSLMAKWACVQEIPIT